MERGTASSYAGSKFVKKYLVTVISIICLVILSVFWGFHYRTNAILEQQLYQEGRAFFQEIVLTREWAAQHQGVYVRPKPGEVLNPYLEQVPGLKSRLVDGTGQEYILKNPALITREISEMGAKDGLFRFRITSLKPFNPGNQPDAFENRALQAFETGAPEYTAWETNERGERLFRYMAPLLVQPSCLRCHALQGYQEGEIRGGISVAVQAAETTRKMEENRWFLLGMAGLISAMVVVVIGLVAKGLLAELRKKEEVLVELAMRDALTGLLNRREGHVRLQEEIARAARTGSPLSMLLIDVDHFKQVNDQYGHAVGDMVLQSVAARMTEVFRQYDLNCRHGGEEFIVGLPGVDAGQAAAAGERIRQSISNTAVAVGAGKEIHLSISVGTASWSTGDDLTQLLYRADRAVYRAKEKGRNRVEMGEQIDGRF